MANGSSRIVPVLLSLIIGFAVGWYINRERPAVAKGTGLAIIGPRASDNSLPEVHLSKTDGDVLLLVSKKKGRHLVVETDENVFENTSPGKYAKYRLSCQARRCYSDEIKADVPEGKRFKYWQVLIDPSGQNEDKQDGWIIIDR
jgi:hypothetical protein